MQIVWDEERVDNTDPNVLVLEARILLNGKPGLKNKELAQRMLDSAFRRDPSVSWMIGYHLERDGDIKEAIKWYELSAANGDPSAHRDLGHLYYWGEKVPGDYVKARQHLRQANGGVSAHSMAKMHFYGLGGSANMADAEKWFKIAAKLGNILAMRKLAQLYLDGKFGYDDKYIHALSWLMVASHFGDKRAFNSVDKVKFSLSQNDIERSSKMADAFIKLISPAIFKSR